MNNNFTISFDTTDPVVEYEGLGSIVRCNLTIVRGNGHKAHFTDYCEAPSPQFIDALIDASDLYGEIGLTPKDMADEIFDLNKFSISFGGTRTLIGRRHSLEIEHGDSYRCRTSFMGRAFRQSYDASIIANLLESGELRPNWFGNNFERNPLRAWAPTYLYKGIAIRTYFTE